MSQQVVGSAATGDTLGGTPVDAAARPVARVTEQVVQRAADASIWLLFRISRVRS